jgi:hypothetical protein
VPANLETWLEKPPRGPRPHPRPRVEPWIGPPDPRPPDEPRPQDTAMAEDDTPPKKRIMGLQISVVFKAQKLGIQFIGGNWINMDHHGREHQIKIFIEASKSRRQVHCRAEECTRPRAHQRSESSWHSSWRPTTNSSWSWGERCVCSPHALMFAKSIVQIEYSMPEQP